VIMFVRSFSVMHGQPRLAIVTATFATCMVDLVHFSVVFLILSTLFGSLGYALFGREIEAFSSPLRALWGCSRLLFGEFEWEVLVEAGIFQAEGIAFIGAFTMLVTVVLMNMLLAIIIDAYENVKAQLQTSSSTETLWSQVAELFDRWRRNHKGSRIPFANVLSGLKEMHDELGPDHLVSRDLLLKYCYRESRGVKITIPEQQCFVILTEVASENERAQPEQLPEELSQRLDQMDGRFDSIEAMLATLLQNSSHPEAPGRRVEHARKPGHLAMFEAAPSPPTGADGQPQAPTGGSPGSSWDTAECSEQEESPEAKRVFTVVVPPNGADKRTVKVPSHAGAGVVELGVAEC